jgi:hypothetical protein
MVRRELLMRQVWWRLAPFMGAGALSFERLKGLKQRAGWACTDQSGLISGLGLRRARKSTISLGMVRKFVFGRLDRRKWFG